MNPEVVGRIEELEAQRTAMATRAVIHAGELAAMKQIIEQKNKEIDALNATLEALKPKPEVPA